MSGCVKCGSNKAYWTIKDKDNKTQDYCDDCFKKYNLSDYKKEMEEYHKQKKLDEAKKIEDEIQNKKEAENKFKEGIIRGGFGEPYCSDACYDAAGKDISSRRFQGVTGVCGFCQKSVSASFYNPGESVLFPYKNQSFFICSGCIEKGKSYVSNIKECCMCGKVIDKQTKATFEITFKNKSDAYDTDFVSMILIKETRNNNQNIPTEIREYIDGKRKGDLSFSVSDLPSGGAKVAISLK